MSLFVKKSSKSIPLQPLRADDFQQWLNRQDRAIKKLVTSTQFKATSAVPLLIPDDKGRIERAVFILKKPDSAYAYAALPAQLPEHDAGYFIDADMTDDEWQKAALGWSLGSYKFNQYKSQGSKKRFAKLAVAAPADLRLTEAMAAATTLVRDMVNIPANDMGPDEIEQMARKTAKPFKTSVNVIKGQDLVRKNYPAIFEVGKGSPRAPRLIDIRWGQDKKLPLVTLVGKGVAFDTGGLDIKPPSNMLLMKKDMGGAAHVLGLAHVIMSMKLPVRLRVLIAAVENAVDGHSFRPGDIINTRKGLTVEIGNTDAEGRVILADALYEACREKPSLLVNFATLTGAARVALGPELPALFSNDDETADALIASSKKTEDWLWHMPLWQGYDDMLSSPVADLNNAGGSFAGAVTAALFMNAFVDKDVKWAHIDTYAWNAKERPGKPAGGEALGMRAAYDMIATTFGTGTTTGRKKTAQKGQKKS